MRPTLLAPLLSALLTGCCCGLAAGERREAAQRPTDAPHPPTTTPPTRPKSATPAQVTEVIDGDTIVVRLGAELFHVRYIGIDAPELHDPATGLEEPYAREATVANERLVGGRTVYLEPDVSDTDRHGRLLRYVWVDDTTMASAELARLGYARVKRYPPDTHHQEFLEAMQREAQEARRGIWSAG